jgi:hypothetical protein
MHYTCAPSSRSFWLVALPVNELRVAPVL